MTADFSNTIDIFENSDYAELLKSLQATDFDFFQSSDSSTSAGYLDGFAETSEKHVRHDDNCGDLEQEKTVEISGSLRKGAMQSLEQAMPSRPSTPLNRNNMSG